MELAKISARVRPRGRWEAIDLGLTMTRTWWRSVWLAWFAVTLPVFIGLVVMSVFLEWHVELPDNFYEIYLWGARPWYRPNMLLIIWLMKPVFDRFILLLLSRRLFGEQLTIWQVVKQWPRFLFVYGWADLTLRRLDPSRSVSQPVSLLEGLNGSERRKRVGILKRNIQFSGLWLTCSMYIIEFLLAMMFLSILLVVIPSTVDVDPLVVLSEYKLLSLIIVSVCFYLGMSITEPLFVGGGFALYLNRRTLIEGWDIELSFRRLAERVKQRQDDQREAVKRVISGILIAALFTAGTVISEPVMAETMAEKECREWREMVSEEGGSRSKQAIREVLKQDEFDVCREIKVWEYIDADESEKEGDGKNWFVDLLDELFEWLMGRDHDDESELDLSIGKIFASMIELVLWIGAVVLIAWLAYKVITYVKPGSFSLKRPKHHPPPPQELFGLSVTTESLPPDVSEQALLLCREGRYREALSLLYRGALALLLEQHRIVIPGSATEGDCQQAVQAAVRRQLSDFFTKLTRLWLQTAYAHREPPVSEIETICADWKSHFEVGNEH